MSEPKPIKTHGFRWRFGVVVLWSREHWILRGVTLLAALTVASSALFQPSYHCNLYPWICGSISAISPNWPIALLVVAGIAALASLLDLAADRHEKRVEMVALAGETAAVGKSVSALISFLEDVSSVVFREDKVRLDRVEALNTSVASTSLLIPVASAVRATYYPLTFDHSGKRVLENPVSRGRPDPATTIWRESDEPNHYVWKLMDGSDLSAVIASAPDSRFGTDWDTRTYKAFISVPVKAKNVQFGMLSVNAPSPDAFTEVDRLLIITAARILAAALSLESPTSDLNFRNKDSSVT